MYERFYVFHFACKDLFRCCLWSFCRLEVTKAKDVRFDGGGRNMFSSALQLFGCQEGSGFDPLELPHPEVGPHYSSQSRLSQPEEKPPDT